MAAGLRNWRVARFDLFRVNPPLVRTMATAPVMLAGPEVDWREFSLDPRQRPEFAIGRQFIRDHGLWAFWLFTLARWACIPFSVLGAWICFRWARELYGDLAGLVALGLWCFSPMILGHGALMTCDVPAAALAVAAAYCFWRWLKSPGWSRALVAGLVLGLAELTKFTLVVFFPLWPVLWVVWRLGARQSQSVPGKPTGCSPWALRTQAGQLAVILLLAIYVINLGYGYEGSLKPLGDYEFVSKMFGGEEARPQGGVGNRFAGTWLGAIPVPLPENYLRGIDRQRLDFEEKRWSFLRGEWRFGGWPYYYLYALAIKVPLGTWLIAILAVVATVVCRRYSARWRDELLLLAPMLTILALVSSQTGVQYLRYALPMYPFAFIWMSKVARAFEFGWGKGTVPDQPSVGARPGENRDSPRVHRGIACVVGVSLAWSVGSSLYYYPHSLSYFNELVGGPTGGHYHLGDSNIDWGQDLLYLKEWYDAHPEARPLSLALFCPLVDPKAVGIDSLPPSRQSPAPGWYAISVNELHRRDHAYDYFLRLEPVAMAGYSIYIYHVTLEEANRVRRELGLPELGERMKDEG